MEITECDCCQIHYHELLLLLRTVANQLLNSTEIHCGDGLAPSQSAAGDATSRVSTGNPYEPEPCRRPSI
jgi:hypothetical protein